MNDRQHSAAIPALVLSCLLGLPVHVGGHPCPDGVCPKTRKHWDACCGEAWSETSGDCAIARVKRVDYETFEIDGRVIHVEESKVTAVEHGRFEFVCTQGGNLPWPDGRNVRCVYDLQTVGGN